MRKVAAIVLWAAAIGAVAHLVVHRRVVAAMLNGDPIPEPPAWHKNHPGL